MEARAPKRARVRQRAAAAADSTDSLDAAVRRLEREPYAACPPAWSTGTGLLAVAVPPPSTSTSTFNASPLLEAFLPRDAAVVRSTAAPSIHLTHFGGTSAAAPRTRATLPVPVPTLPDSTLRPEQQQRRQSQPSSRRITHLSFSPDSSHLVAVLNDPDGRASDLITLYEQRGACIDEWDCVAQEDCARFGATPNGPVSLDPEVGSVRRKQVVSLRWVGEPRRWYPSPTFPDQAREETKKPLYCAPPRSAPLEGVAFIAILSSDEILFMHYPRHAPGLPPVPTAVCVPLHPSPRDLRTPTFTSNPEALSADEKACSRTATALNPTPVPLVLSLGPGLGTVVVPAVSGPPNAATLGGGPAMNGAVKTGVETPSATVDALVSSLVVKTEGAGDASSAAGNSGGRSAAQKGYGGGRGEGDGGGNLGGVPAPTELGSSQAALHAELETQQQQDQKRRMSMPAGGDSESAIESYLQRSVDKAAIGACRSRGTAEVGETVFVVASWSRMGPRRVQRAGKPGRDAHRGTEAPQPASEEVPMSVAAVMPPPPASAAAAVSTTVNGIGAAGPAATKTDSFMADDDFSLLADFSSLEEAFGGPAPVANAAGLQDGVPGGGSEAKGEAPRADEKPQADAAPPAGGLVNGTGAVPGADGVDDEQRELDEHLKSWSEARDAGRVDEAATLRWRVELTEVRVEMLNPEGPRITVRPQPPLHLSPLPATAGATSTSDSDLECADPILTHLTFLGDVNLPHPLQQTTSSPSLALDGSEAAVDLSLLAVTAHRHSSPPTSPTGASQPSRWSSTLTSYALSKEEAYPLSEAFQALEGRKVDAPMQVEGESSWVARLAACKPAPSSSTAADAPGRGGVLCAVEIRPGGGEWASVTALVASPKSRDSEAGDADVRWESSVVRISSVTLEALDGESAGGVLPGGRLYDSVVNSPNGAFLCALPEGDPHSPVLTGAPLGFDAEAASDSSKVVEPLAVRLAIAVVRQGDAGDLVGRIIGLRDSGRALAVVQRTGEILRSMLPAEAMLEASSLGMELLAIAGTLYRGHPELGARADTARKVLEVAACVRALKKSEKRERGISQNYRPDADAIWPLVGHCSWFCSTFLDSLATDLAAPRPSSAEDPAIVPILHPRFRTLLSTAARAFLALDAWLALPESGVEASDAVDLARTIVHDAVTNALDGSGLATWVSALDKVTSEMDGGPSMSGVTPAPFWSMAVPVSQQAQATSIRALMKAALPSSYLGKAAALPSPPPTPTAVDRSLDLVRRARFSARLPPGRSCARCGAQTAAVEGAATGPEAVGQWRRFEAEWDGRCLCGGLWRRTAPS